MTTTYILEGVYYNGDQYADKFDDLEQVEDALASLENQDHDGTPPEYRVNSKAIKISREVA